jgi:REP element-mobilizing transposase RayT
MSRPLRIEFPGALYHVTSRGDRREMIFVDDADRVALLGVVGQAAERFDAQALAYCLMGNHYHFVLHTRAANLSRLMRHVNGVFTQLFNRRHGKVGHLFQGRFKSILVDRDSYLLEVCRYVELNPVRAGMVTQAQEWPWSSFRAHTGQAAGFDWLDTAGLHAFLLGREPNDAADMRRARTLYARHVEAGRDVRLWEQALRQQIYLGDDRFVERMQAREARSRHGLAPPPTRRSEVPRAQREPPRRQPDLAALMKTRGVALDQALCAAYRAGGVTMSALAAQCGLSVSRVSRLIARAEHGSVEKPGAHADG